MEKFTAPASPLPPISVLGWIQQPRATPPSSGQNFGTDGTLSLLSYNIEIGGKGGARPRAKSIPVFFLLTSTLAPPMPNIVPTQYLSSEEDLYGWRLLHL